MREENNKLREAMLSGKPAPAAAEPAAEDEPEQLDLTAAEPAKQPEKAPALKSEKLRQIESLLRGGASDQ